MDLRNDLRKTNGMETQLGNGDQKTDWKRAAKICVKKC